MAGPLRLLYAIFASTLMQDKLKKNEDFVLPINEFAVMIAMLTVWISQAVQVMQQSKQRKEKILQCCEKTGYWMCGRRRDRVAFGGSGKA